MAAGAQLFQGLQGGGAPAAAEGRSCQGPLQGAGIELQAPPADRQAPVLGGLEQGGAVVTEADAEIEHLEAVAGREALQLGRGHEFALGLPAGPPGAVEGLAKGLAPEGGSAIGRGSPDQVPQGVSVRGIGQAIPGPWCSHPRGWAPTATSTAIGPGPSSTSPRSPCRRGLDRCLRFDHGSIRPGAAPGPPRSRGRTPPPPRGDGAGWGRGPPGPPPPGSWQRDGRFRYRLRPHAGEPRPQW